MRIGLILVVIVVLSSNIAMADKLTADPNAPGVRKIGPSVGAGDPRLAQKITYKVRLKPMTTILADLSEKTGIKMYVGKSPADWRVREDVATIHVNDLPLNELMDSLARVMKFSWLRSGPAPDWSYRLVESHAQAREIRQAEEQRQRITRELRRKALDQFMSVDSLPEDLLSRLREQNPDLYVDYSSGALKHAAKFLRAAPDVAQAWLDCKNEEIPVRALSAEAREALRDLTRADREKESAMNGELDAGARAAIADDAQRKSSSGFVKIFEGTPEDPYYGIDVPGGGNLGLTPPQDDYGRLQAKVRLKAYEEKRPIQDVTRDMRSEFAKLPAPNYATMLPYYTSEEALKHDDEPFLHDKLKSKVQSKRISALIFELAEATGLNVITDDFRGTNYFCSAADGREVGKALADITSTHRRMNWSRSGTVLEIWNRDWYHRRQGRVSQEWLAGTRERFRTTGTLDIADLVEMAELTDQQIHWSIESDRVLRPVGRLVRHRQQYLALYASLTPEQTALLFSPDGLSLSDLTDEQQKAAARLSASVELPFVDDIVANMGAKVYASKLQDGNALVYTLRASSALGPVGSQLTFRTPVYNPPMQPGKDDVAKAD